MGGLAGLCEVCWEAPAEYRCKLCGRFVCKDHYDASRGLCSICASSICELCGSKLAITFCPSCGRLVCYDDSVQLDNVRRVCKECYAKGIRSAHDLGPGRAYVEGAIRLAGRVVRLRGSNS